MKLRGSLAALALAASLAVSGCEFAPSNRPPTVALPSQFTDSSGSTGGVYSPDGAWWRVFGDPLLDRLEEDVDAANPDLAAAFAIYQASRARAQEAVSGLFPEVDFGGALSANKQSDNRPLRSKTQPTYYGANQADAGVASFELDVWGRVADLVKAAKARSEASGDALADARLSLHAQLARAYVDLRSLDAEAKLLADTIKLYNSALGLTQQRLQAKIAPPVDEQRATAQLASVRAQAADLALRRTALVDAIATLAGKAAPGFTIPVNATPMRFPRRPRAVPGDVLLRRPDVAQAERAFAAAVALVGSARANRYPRFTIGLIGGTQDTSLRLLDPANTFYTIGPSMSVPLFDAGLREAEVKEAEANMKFAAERYRSSVLNAVREVQDDISGLRWLAVESAQSQTASAAAMKALEMSNALYKDGAASFLDVVTAQDSALLAQRSGIGVQSQLMETYVGLLLALGGGWSAPVEEPAPGIAELQP